MPVDLWPFPYAIDIPLYALLFGALFFGVVWGGVATWSKAGRKRRDARQKYHELRSQAQEIQRLKKEVEDLKAEIKSRDQIVSRETVPQLNS